MVPILEFMVDWAMQIQGPTHVQTAGRQVCQIEDASFETAREVDPFGNALLENHAVRIQNKLRGKPNGGCVANTSTRPHIETTREVDISGVVL